MLALNREKYAAEDYRFRTKISRETFMRLEIRLLCRVELRTQDIRKSECSDQKVVVIKRLQGNSGRKSSLFAGAVAIEKFLLAKHYNLVMIACAAVGYRGLID